MIPKTAKLRAAHPTNHLEKNTQMYIKGLGFELISSFEDLSRF
ncbi:hypothetical protein [Celerinatantimonas sp. MCCC 1A17872]